MSKWAVQATVAVNALILLGVVGAAPNWMEFDFARTRWFADHVASGELLHCVGFADLNCHRQKKRTR